MNGSIRIVALAVGVAACSAGDDTVEGARGPCAFGGELTDCPDAARTPEGACWRLVDCGAIVVASDNENRFTWGDCVDSVDGLTADRRGFVINCIAASTCDELRVGGQCGRFGDD